MRLTVLLAFLLMLLAIAGTTAAYTVTMNFAIRIGDSPDDMFRVNDTTINGVTANSSVVLLMHLDNSTLDSSQYGNNGTLNGANCTGVSGKIGSACSFDGINDYISLSSSIPMSSGEPVSISVWVKANVAQSHALFDLNISPGLLIYHSSTDGGTSSTFIGFRSEHEMYTPSNSLTNGVWNHIVYIYNGSDDDLVTSYAIYINGVSQELTRRASIIGGSSPATNVIGADGGGTSNYFNGTIDEVIIFNRTLTTTEVSNIYGVQSLTFNNLNKKYIASTQGNTTTAIVSAGTLLNARLNTTYNSTHYLFQMTQDSSDNRFLIAATNGTYLDVEDKLSMIDTIRMVSSTFGRFALNVPASFPLFVRLEYTSIDLYGRVFWSDRGQLRIRNRGLTGRNLPNITMEVVRR